MNTAADPKAKHGLAAGDAGRPDSPDWTVPQHWDRYTAAEHGVWKTLYERQSKLLPGRVCRAFQDGMRSLPIEPDRVPDFRRLSDALLARTGWQVVAVPGLVPDEVFYEHLANRRFPSGQFIRKPDELDYLEEPDVFHDVFGHVPLLTQPVFADYMQAYGEGGLRALRLGHLDRLARLYWYTVEFGLVREDGGLRICGAGIASSFTETIFALEDPSPNRVALTLERVMRTRFRIDDFQETYFVLSSLDQLLDFTRIDFAPVYERVAALPEVEPRDLLDGDTVITRGTGRYHRERRQSQGTIAP